jgi:hypothetical protein
MDDRDFFHESPEQFNRVQTLIDEDLLKPTTNLNDLVSDFSVVLLNSNLTRYHRCTKV